MMTTAELPPTKLVWTPFNKHRTKAGEECPIYRSIVSKNPWHCNRSFPDLRERCLAGRSSGDWFRSNRGHGSVSVTGRRSFVVGGRSRNDLGGVQASQQRAASVLILKGCTRSSFFALKGRDRKAQGNALGTAWRYEGVSALKGRARATHRGTGLALSGRTRFGARDPQGDALGFSVWPFQGRVCTATVVSWRTIQAGPRRSSGLLVHALRGINPPRDPSSPVDALS
jgi:hypothetical protein